MEICIFTGKQSHQCQKPTKELIEGISYLKFTILSVCPKHSRVFLVSYPTERRGRKGETLHPSAVKQGNGLCCPKNGDVGHCWPGMEDQSNNRSWRRIRTVR